MLRSRFLACLLTTLIVSLAIVGGPSAEAQNTATAARIESADGVQSAVSASRIAFAGGAEEVLIASVEDFADALSASALAGAIDAPILFSRRDLLPEETAAELQRLGAERVTILGGSQAVSPQVTEQLRDDGIEVSRLAGANRFETAAMVAATVANITGTRTAYLALGSHPDPDRAWVDAVAVSGLAAHAGSPVLLTAPDELPVETIRVMTEIGLTSITIVGGTAAIGSAVSDELADSGLQVDRIGGASRYHTSMAVAEAAVRAGAAPDELWVTTGGKFEDALVAGPAAVARGGVMMLAESTDLDQQPVGTFTATHRETLLTVRLLGSGEVLTDHLLHHLRDILRGAVPVDAVTIPPGADAQAIVDSHPAGTTFAFLPGTHRGVSISARSGDTFVGFPGAVLDGARALPTADFTSSGGRWMLDGIPSTLQTSGGFGCQPWNTEGGHIALCGHEQEVHRSEQLFLDGVRLRHVNAPHEVDRPGTWHYDASAQVVWMHDAPAGRDVRMTDTQTAFQGYRANDVTIHGLTIRRYGPRTLIGAIDALNTERWTISDTEISYSHGYGLRIGEDTTVTRSALLDNGQMGIGGSANGTAVTITDNQVARNGSLGIQRSYSIGGMKIMESHGALIADNHVVDNAAKGVWLDVYNVDSTIRDNLVERSGQTGILFEISRGGVIQGNTLLDNHTDGDTSESYGSLQVVSSRDVQVLDNVMRGGGAQELTIYDTDQADGVANVFVARNDITVDTSWNEGTYGMKDLRADKTVPIAGVVFTDNTLRIVTSAPFMFAWDSRLINADDWLRAHPSDRIVTAD